MHLFASTLLINYLYDDGIFHPLLEILFGFRILTFLKVSMATLDNGCMHIERFGLSMNSRRFWLWYDFMHT